MAQLLVRGLEEETVDSLRERANTNGRSLEAEARQILRQAAQSPKRSRKETEDSIRRIRALFKTPQSTDSVDLIREDRCR